MTGEQEEFTLSCDECGQNSIIRPEKLTDDSVITCDACGAEYGSWGSFKETLRKQVAEFFQTTIGKALEGVEGVKFTKPIN